LSKRHEPAGLLCGTVATIFLPLLCGCIPALHVASPTQLTLRPSACLSDSFTCGMDDAYFSRADSAIEVSARGVKPSEHETYLTAYPLAPYEPVTDIERWVWVSGQAPSLAALDSGHAVLLDCRVELVLGKRHRMLPGWIAGVYSGVMPATVQLSGQRLHVELSETELRCLGGGIGPLWLGGRVVARLDNRGLDSDRKLFLEEREGAIQRPPPGPGQDE
jgi:hypothetical protein